MPCESPQSGTHRGQQQRTGACWVSDAVPFRPSATVRCRAGTGTINEKKGRARDDDDAPFWFFEHEDGDGEELELDEVKAAVKLFKEQPATKNARQILSETVYALGTEYTARFNEIVW